MQKAKRILGLFLTVCLVFALSACGEGGIPAEGNTNGLQTPSAAETNPPAGSQTVEQNQPSPANTGALVAYFSATGNTKAVAEQLANITGAELYEILPADPYTSEDLDYGNEQSRTSLEMDNPDARPQIGSEPIAIEQYSTLYLGYPIWHGQAPRIMSTFVESYDFDGITVIPFCTSGGSGIGASGEQLAALAGSGTWLAGERFSGSASASDLQAWLNAMQ